MKQPPRYRHRYLLEDQDIKRWYANLCRGFKVTADVYTRRLGAICNLSETTPRDLVEQGKLDWFEFDIRLA